MNFSWPEAYLKFKEEVIDFARRALNDDIIRRDADGAFSRDLWEKCADFGLQGLSIPAQYGGSLEKVDFLRAMLAMEGLGYGCEDNGLCLALNAQLWTVQLPILEFGNEAQKNKYLKAMAAGKHIGAHGLSEPEAGSDVYSMQTRAEKVEGGYVLNGQKHLITLGPIADLVMVLASTKPEMGKWGLSAFILEKGMKGFRQSPVQSKMGMRTVPIGRLNFEDCFVPEEQRIGAEGVGFSLMSHALEYDRCCILASQLGAMERQLERSIDYVKGRRQFGQSVGKFQSVSNRIANMKLRLETSRLLLYKTAWLKSEGQSAMMESALLKLQLSEGFLDSSIDAIRNHGGIGYLSETGVERDLRDAMGGVLYAGTSDIQRNIIAKLLGF